MIAIIPCAKANGGGSKSYGHVQSMKQKWGSIVCSGGLYFPWSCIFVWTVFPFPHSLWCNPKWIKGNWSFICMLEHIRWYRFGGWNLPLELAKQGFVDKSFIYLAQIPVDNIRDWFVCPTSVLCACKYSDTPAILLNQVLFSRFKR